MSESTWELLVYDCDISMTPDVVLNNIMTPFTSIILSLMRQSGLFDRCDELQGDQLQLMSFRRAPPDAVPQTKSRLCPNKVGYLVIYITITIDINIF